MKYKQIIFDCDSTLVTLEGLDELARLKGCESKVKELTALSMDAVVKLEDVFALKMAMIKPSYSDMELLGKIYLDNLVEDVRGVVALLNKMGKNIFQVTGNFYPAIKILCKELGISENNIFANSIYFNERGEYVGFDSKGPLSISGGKRQVVDEIAKNYPKEGIVFVGDGSTDMETKPPVHLFIGYGGVIRRENVRKNSDYYINSESLAPLLEIIFDDKEKIEATKINPSLMEKSSRLFKNSVEIINDKYK